jgi:hypothetical protein
MIVSLAYLGAYFKIYFFLRVLPSFREHVFTIRFNLHCLSSRSLFRATLPFSSLLLVVSLVMFCTCAAPGAVAPFKIMPA